ncbi:P pilus assembly protein, chaperone PapD [Pseudomonas antarctica]|uniref:Chaperone protein EcpD n=1 Tax=Pseudomonas antarctica TaxID=219572 RepID=A0A1G9ZBF5_9PSED|nr:molecular chaperone [Pseudomonas antarctica]KAF2411123.1 chaperone protein EcpD precursor [Pseudomonas antarctica]SDN18659.1 P pilus assembly protein, chaperone PapD [Pseudomonas antarctica]
MFLLRLVILACGLLALAPPPASAALKIEGTRLIYFGQDKGATINVVNQAPREVVVQTWITGEDEATDRTVPFAATEPLVQLAAGEHHPLRILYAGEGLPSDRESLFWLNIMEIPLKPEDPNSVQFAIRQRLKLFYRPPALQGGSAEAVQQLVWSSGDGRTVTVRNPSAFHLSLVNLQTDNEALSDYLLLKPYESKTLTAPSPLPKGTTLHFTEITDIGLQARHRAALN